METRFLHRSRSVLAKMSFDYASLRSGQKFQLLQYHLWKCGFQFVKTLCINALTGLVQAFAFNFEDALRFQNICQSFDLII